MTAFRTFAAALFLAIASYTAVTISQYGLGVFPIFFGDLASFSWRGQFNFDFALYLILSGLWMAWRSGFSRNSIASGVIAPLFGMVFLSAYVLYLSFKTDGDIRKLLLGVHA